MASTGLLNWFKMNWGATRLISFKTLLGPDFAEVSAQINRA
jgi:hypothetical protein